MRVQSTTVWAAGSAKPDGGRWEVYFALRNGNAGAGARFAPKSPEAFFNQEIDLFVSAAACAAIGAQALRTAVDEILRLAGGVKLGFTHRPWTDATPDPKGGPTRLDLLIDRRYGTSGSLELRENPWAPWSDSPALG